MVFCSKSLLLGLAAVVMTLVPLRADIGLDNTAGVFSSVSTFGLPDSQTYGEVFTAPITGKLTLFSLWLEGGVGSLEGAVGTWNGGASYALGWGSPIALYVSAPVASTGTQQFTFSPNINVVAGQQYVAFLSVFGDAGAGGTTAMPLSSSSVTGIDYFVWNNSTTPYGNPSWNYFFDAGNAEFQANFTATPEPGAVLLTVTMLLGVALLARKRMA
jgi:hypothetical protein